jgi:hypothetical protein
MALICVGFSAAMLLAGQTVLRASLRGEAFLWYWLICFGLTVAAILLALIELRGLRFRAREEHRELMEEALRDLQSPDEDQEEGTGCRR